MKRKITFLLAALLLMSGLTWAQQITWSAADQGYENGQLIESVTFDDHVSAEFFAGTNNNAPKYYNTGTAIRCYGGNYFTVVSDYLLTEIVFGFSSGEGTNAITTDCGDYADGTWTGSANSVTFTIGGTSGHRRFATFTISYTESGTPAPTITIENNNELAYNATSGSFNFTVNNPVSGGNMTVATEEEWISNPTIAGSAVNFTTTVNQAGAPREGIITLTYTYGEQTITKPVTITQAGNPNIVDNISDITEAGNYSVQGTIVAINNRGFVLGDGTGYVYYFNNTNDFDPADYSINDKVKLAGPVVVYGGVFEFNNSTEITYVSESNYVGGDPIVLSGAEMDARVASTTPPQLSSYVQYEGTLTVSGNYYNITNIAGATTAKGSISYPLNGEEIAALNGKQVVVTGYYVGVSSSQYYNTMIGSVVEKTDPAILLDTYAIDVPAEGGEGIVNVTYQNFNHGEGSVYVDFVGENGYDWITAEIDENYNVHYVVDANQGAARTAYFIVEFVYEDEIDFKFSRDGHWDSGYESDTVTVSQEAYVAPTYAELPFEFDGGRADIAETDGLYHNGLDSDYSNSPKLKFNTTGDWLLLQFNGVPGTLTFDIKGNPGGNPSVWAGTFKVQTSVDGETYTDLGTYTDLTTTVQSESFDLNENVRYIKWIYTEKVSGNVALGNIHLYEFGGGPVVETYELTIEPFENLEIFTFVGDELTEPLEGAGTIQVSEGEQVMLSVSAEEGYVMQSLMVDGVEHVNDIDEDLTYTFVMPNHNVTVSATAVEDVPPTPFEPATYTLATSIEEGKTYIIVGKKTIDEEDEYYAMGEQRTNNRAGVAISCDGYTATVETADVHEFVIDAAGLEIWDLKNLRDGGLVGTVGWFSIYDTDGSGYLYAASSTDNRLKTEAELDDNGVWAIDVEEETGLFSIVASGSNTHNVMQFNGSNTLFNCYTSDSQLPVYLYVKDETPTTLTQTIDLTAGVNYVSFNVETNLDDLKAALVDALGTSATITVKSRVASTKYQRGRWAGNLSELNMAEMYKIDVPTDSEISLEGMPIDPTTLSVTITPGANWIAYPYTVEMTLPEFFGSFPVTNDVVKSKSQNSKYNRGRWAGSLTGLVPGQGYIYVSADDDAEGRTFTFPASAK